MYRGVEGSRLLIIPGSGHLSTMEAPAAVTSALSDLLAELDQRQ
jgi:pimeloyl-ACP methyl ester carboxylesterase